MPYCSIERTKCYYDAIFPAMKMVLLEEDAKFGTVFGDYILCEQGNSIVLEEINGFVNMKEADKIKAGRYAQLTPLNLISVIVSDRDDLNIEGFTKHESITVFHPLLGFEDNNGELGAEILDLDKEKEKIVCRYYYVNNMP